MKQAYTTEDVAKKVGVTARTLYRWLESGDLKEPAQTAKVGNKVIRFWTVKDILRVRAFVKSRRVPQCGLLRNLLKAQTWRQVKAKPGAIRFDTEQARGPLAKFNLPKIPAALLPGLPQAQGPVPAQVGTVPVSLPPKEVPSAQQGPKLTAQYGNGAEILSIEQVASRLQVKPAVVYGWTRGRAVARISIMCQRVGMQDIGPLPHVKVGKELRFSWPDVCEWLDKRQQLEMALQQQRATQPKRTRRRKAAKQ